MKKMATMFVLFCAIALGGCVTENKAARYVLERNPDTRIIAQDVPDNGTNFMYLLCSGNRLLYVRVSGVSWLTQESLVNLGTSEMCAK